MLDRKPGRGDLLESPAGPHEPGRKDHLGRVLQWKGFRHRRRVLLNGRGGSQCHHHAQRELAEWPGHHGGCVGEAVPGLSGARVRVRF
ncbi:unnamed protein product [Symbiodinium sp. CCMP2592]|nr:unnamed protein product [Symbiodinium sp. CCMP2592]